jgi:uncharacterized DUF497 family protein
MEFQWDPEKNQSNIEKHGLSFEEASELFKMPENLVLEEYDFEHSLTEDRIISIGPILRGITVVVSVERNDGDTIRLISARFASTAEQKRYVEVIAGMKDE